MGRKRFNPCGEFERFVLDSKNGELWGKYLSFDNAMKRFVRNLYAQYKSHDADANLACECVAFAEETFSDVPEDSFARFMLGSLFGFSYNRTFDGVKKSDVRLWVEKLKTAAQSKPYFGSQLY